MRIFIFFAVTGRIRVNPVNLSKTNGLSEMSGTLNRKYFHFLFQAVFSLSFNLQAVRH
jgi:hypothetical protein